MRRSTIAVVRVFAAFLVSELVVGLVVCGAGQAKAETVTAWSVPNMSGFYLGSPSNPIANFVSLPSNANVKALTFNSTNGDLFAASNQGLYEYSASSAYSSFTRLTSYQLTSGTEDFFAAYGGTVPEPSTFALLGIGAISLLAYARRRWAA